jgi:diguanylate cyclase (GGDEF)-like protein
LECALIKPPRPPDEDVRLRTLRSLNILDTPAEERFDRLTRIARRIFHVPIALVSLVDENRQWFKSNAGLTIFETPRDISFCGHAILGDDVFIIPDALEDDRFADNPLVLHEPHIRFYAGCPLRSLDGSKLGTLCIIDTEPRGLTEEEIEILRDLARMAEHELAAIEMATLDELTLLANRRGFVSDARHTLSLCRRQGIPAALVFMDLDDFKAINDEFGHAEGDLALKHFAEQMRESFRMSDLCARLGGDEFVVLLTNATKEIAESVTSRFHRSLAHAAQDSNRGYEIRFSYGIVEFDPQEHDSVESLLAAGDRLMYTQKAALYATKG